jgi:hypothetical protein
MQASQPLARIARLYWDDHGDYLCDPEGFGQLMRPARRRCTARRCTARRCTARRGIAGPVACRLPPHLTVCRRTPAVDRPLRPHLRRPARHQPVP